MKELGINTDAYLTVERKYSCLEIHNCNVIPQEYIPQKSDTHFVLKDRLFPIEQAGLLGPDSLCICCGYLNNTDDMIKVLKSGEGHYMKADFAESIFESEYNTGDTIVDLKTGKEYSIIETYHTSLFPTVIVLPLYCISDSEHSYWISEDDLLYKKRNLKIAVKRNPERFIFKKSFSIAETIVKPLFFIEEGTGLFGGKLLYREQIINMVFNLSGDNMNYGTDKLPACHGYVPSSLSRWIEYNKIGFHLTGNNGARYDISGYELMKFNIEESQLPDYSRHSSLSLPREQLSIPHHFLQKSDFKDAVRYTARIVKHEQNELSEEAIIYHLSHGYGDEMGY